MGICFRFAQKAALTTQDVVVAAGQRSQSGPFLLLESLSQGVGWG